jgi:ribosomal protein S12 methylthiotransferase
MAGLLREKGFSLVPGGRADVAVLNTCGFVRAAKEESIEEILGLAREKRKGRIRLLVLAGCLARRYRDELPGLLPEVDLFLGPGDIPVLPGILAGMLRGAAGRGGRWSARGRFPTRRTDTASPSPPPPAPPS